MDLSGAIGAEFRTVQDLTHNGEPARAVIGSRVYPTDIQDLWQALTEPERLARWFLPVSGDLKVGGRYQLEGNAGGEILRCDAPNALQVSWEFAGNPSWVHVRLEAQGDQTTLHLKHILPKDEANEAHWTQYGPGATGVGWDLSFWGVQLFLEQHGAALDRAQIDAWMASDAGKAFIHDCAMAWGAAHIAAGVDATVANKMADETAKAYTGG